MEIGGLKPLRPLYAGNSTGGIQVDAQQCWGRMKQVCVFQEQGNITSIDFLPFSPYQFASTSRNRLTIYDSSAFDSICFNKRLKSQLYSACYRSDGALLGVCTHEGQVHFFDVAEKERHRVRLENPVRSYGAHKCRVNALAYTPSKLGFASMADDGRVKLWSLAESNPEKPVWKCHGHTDQVRDGGFGKSSEHFLVTGSYDHTVKVWDTRTGGAAAQLTLQHSAPVERLVILDDGRSVATASRSSIAIWDLAAGGRVVHTLQGHHHKTVTSLRLASNGEVLLSGGLDRRVNGFRLNTGEYNLVYALKTASPVLALAVSGDDKLLACGMSNLLAIHKRVELGNAETPYRGEEECGWMQSETPSGTTNNSDHVFRPPENKRLTPLYTTGTKTVRLSAPPVKQRERKIHAPNEYESRVEELTARQLDMMPLGRLDNMLRQRTYRELVRTIARDAKLEAHPEISVSALRQMSVRQKLYTALSGHGSEDLVMFVRFLRLNLFKTPFFAVLHQVTNMLITLYAEEEVSSEAIEELRTFREDLQREIRLRRLIGKSLGVMATILTATTSAKRSSTVKNHKKRHIERDVDTNGISENGSEPVVVNGY